jgi:hypothetical protein
MSRTRVVLIWRRALGKIMGQIRVSPSALGKFPQKITMPDLATHLTLFGLGSCCGYLLFRYDRQSHHVPFYDVDLTAMIAAMMGGGILFNLPYFVVGADSFSDPSCQK